MSEIEKALDRLGDAVARLIEQAPDGDAATVAAEREKLKAELAALKADREEDAQLRAEAASAVRDALRDLRGLVSAGAGR